MKISSIDTPLYCIPLPTVLTDAMHGEMRHFAVATVQVKTESSAEGLGCRIESEGSLPVAIGQNLHTIYEFRKMIAGGGVSFPERDLWNIGGVTGWLKVAYLAEAHNLDWKVLEKHQAEP